MASFRDFLMGEMKGRVTKAKKAAAADLLAAGRDKADIKQILKDLGFHDVKDEAVGF
jgi:hypothetical protein